MEVLDVLTLSAAIISILAIALVIYGRYPYSYWTRLGIPGPPPSWFVGNMPEIFKPAGFRGAFDKWQGQYGRVYGLYNFRTPILVVSDPEMLKLIMVKHFNDFSDRHFFEDGLLVHKEVKSGVFFAGGQTWKRVRSVMTPTFSSAKLRLIAQCVDTCARRLADQMTHAASTGQPVDIKKVATAFSLDVIAASAFSLDVDSLNDLDAPIVRHSRSLFDPGPYIKYFYLMAALFPSLSRPIFHLFNIGIFRSDDLEFFDNTVTALIKERQNNPSKHTDFLQLLINAEVDDVSTKEAEIGKQKLTKDEVVAQCLMMYIAGSETTGSTLQFIAYVLARHQDVQDKLRQEVDALLDTLGESELTYEHCQNLPYMDAVINETLRLYPPLTVTSRLVMKDIELKGMLLPAGTGIWIPLLNISRDPEFFDQPDTFNPERFLQSECSNPVSSFSSSSSLLSTSKPLNFLPFGYGPRICVGMRLAVLELKMALVHMIRSVQLTNAEPGNLALTDVTSMLQPAQPIMIEVTKR